MAGSAFCICMNGKDESIQGDIREVFGAAPPNWKKIADLTEEDERALGLIRPPGIPRIVHTPLVTADRVVTAILVLSIIGLIACAMMSGVHLTGDNATLAPIFKVSE